ncbi:MAG: AAA family ATPase [Ignavibacteriaceae bacterium]|nr:AAA family ATPase [Ignavibacteriaceae bacterium]
MINKISKLDKIAKFTYITQEKVFKFGEKRQNCNIVFGFNGSGKTTLSNAISFFAVNSFISEKEKKDIFDDIKNGNNSVVELELQGNSNIKYPANRVHSKNFYIFNSNFVASHVFNGTKGRLKKFSNIGGEVKNKEIDTINQQIAVLEEERKQLESENKKFGDKHEEIRKEKSKGFGKTLTDKNKRLITQDLSNVQLSNNTIEQLETKLSTLSTDYELSKKQDDLNVDLDELRQLTFNPLAFDFEKIDEILSKNIQQLSKDVLEKKITEIQNLFSDEQHQQSVERWFKYGKDVLEKITEHKGNKCPICNTDISNRLNSLLQDYQGYFDESYENFIAELKTKTDEVSAVITSLAQFEKNTEKLNKQFTKYEKILGQLLFEKFDFSIIKNDFTDLEKALKAKNDNIQSILSKPADTIENLKKLNDAITKLQNLKTSILGVLEPKKLITHTIEEDIRQTYNEIIVLEFNNFDKAGALEKYRKNKERITVIVESKIEGLPFLKNKLRAELKKLKAESRSISTYLVKMGIDHFDIDINENEPDENIVIKYKNSTNDKNKLKNCLSDGEKTALAFAYFLSKFENEINSIAKVKDSVVVIDDPISSLDDNRLYSTAHLIWRNFEEVKQLIVLSHNFLFLKFFNSFYCGRANCLFLDGEKITDLPDELKNFETPYFYMLKRIIDFLDQNNQNVNYNEAKRYLPNFIRRVLETFLSFKFSRTVNRVGGHRSPGLNEFDENIDNTDMKANIKKVLKDKIAAINRIADAHSHGNAHHTQENFYISETDLKTLSQNAISVIETMDKLHITCFVKIEQPLQT